MKKENIYNIPNLITLLRLLITPIIIYTVFADYHIIIVATLFIIGMLTDLFDGQIARRYKLTTEFGRKFDMIADRILLLGTIFAFFIDYYTKTSLATIHFSQIMMLLGREIISFPFAIYSFIKKKSIPKARKIGKATTVLQGITFPMVILSISYPIFNFSIYFSVITLIMGIVSGMHYAYDTLSQ